jgi:hypothetical protein
MSLIEQTSYWGQPIGPSASVALEAWKEGLISEEEARIFFGLGPKKEPCSKCGSK